MDNTDTQNAALRETSRPRLRLEDYPDDDDPPPARPARSASTEERDQRSRWRLVRAGELDPMTPEEKLVYGAKYSMGRRAKLKALGICINGQLPRTDRMNALPDGRGGNALVEHGPPIGKGGKCQRCRNVHKGLNPDGTPKSV